MATDNRGQAIQTYSRSFVATWYTVLALLIHSPVLAHLDPPGPAAFQEVVWLLSITVLDDMDTFGAGELSVTWNVVQPGHAGAAGGIPAAGGPVALNAPPPAAFPGPFPIVLYNHLNCWPLERPLAFGFSLDDADLFGVDTSSVVFVVGPLSGGFVVGNVESLYALVIGVFPTPQFDALCRAGAPIPGGQQPPVPPPPGTPSSGPPISPELPLPPEGPLPGEIPSAVRPMPKPFLKHWDAALATGLVVGIAVGLILMLVGRRMRRQAQG